MEQNGEDSGAATSFCDPFDMNGPDFNPDLYLNQVGNEGIWHIVSWTKCSKCHVFDTTAAPGEESVAFNGPWTESVSTDSVARLGDADTRLRELQQIHFSDRNH